jgi:phytoene dehydrogenase-like protein
LEKAYDAAKYGEISEKPYLEVTTSGNTVSIHFQFAPYALKNGEWKVESGKIEKLAIDTLAEYFPNLKSSIVNRKSLTPQDLEETYGLTEGDLNHGQLMLDQFLFMRPIPGWSNHKTPIDNLYLCGSGVHGGGGVSGAAGRNAAKVLK